MRVIDLKFSGRNLTAPPEGYNARSEANVKRWLATLPAPTSAPPDDVSSIADVPDTDFDDALFYDVRCSGDSFLIHHRGGGDRREGQCATGSVCMALISSGNGSASKLKQVDRQDQSAASILCDDAAHPPPDTTPLHSDSQSPVGMGTLSAINPTDIISKNTESNSQASPNSTTPVSASRGNDEAPQAAADHTNVLHPVVEAAALEVGIERYLGMAEVRPGSDDSQVHLRQALKLAVEDRIRCRMRHIEDSAEWQKTKKQLCKQINLLMIESKHKQELQVQLQDLQQAVQRIKLSAEEEVSRAQQQFEQAQGIMDSTISDLSSRTAGLKCDLRDRESAISKLKDTERRLSLQLLEAEQCNINLKEELSDAHRVTATLEMELKDNVNRWEQECAMRIEAEEALQQAYADLDQAKLAAQAATDYAEKSERAKIAAMQRLSLLQTRKGNLSAVRKALEHQPQLSNSQLPNAAGTPKAGSPMPLCSTQHKSPRGASHAQCAARMRSMAGREQQRLDKVSGVCQSKSERTSGEAPTTLCHDLAAATTSSDFPAFKTSPKFRAATDRYLIRLQAEVVEMAVQRAPNCLKALGFAFRCLIICLPDSCQGAAHAVAIGVQYLYHTMLCILKDSDNQHCALSDPARRSKCTMTETDAHAVEQLLPVCHTVFFVKAAMGTSDATCRRLTDIASSSGCQVMMVQQSSVQPDGDSHVHKQHVADSTHTLTIFPAANDTNSFVLSRAQQEQIESAVGLPDAALNRFSLETLHSIQAQRAPSRTAVSGAAWEPTDLATFNMQQLTKVSLISPDPGTDVETVAENCGAGSQTSNPVVSDSLAPIDVPSGLEVASMLLRANKYLQFIDLSHSPVGVHGARLLAAIILDGCNIHQLVFSAVHLPIGRLLGQTCAQQDQARDCVLDLPGSKLVQEDLVLLTVLFTSGVGHEAIKAVVIRGQVAVPDRILDDFALAIAGADHVQYVQGVPRNQMAASGGRLCLRSALSPASAVSLTGSDGKCDVGTFGVLVAAKILTQGVRKTGKGTDRAIVNDANTLDGALPDDCTATTPLRVIDLTGTQSGSYGNAKLAAAVAARGASSDLNMKLACTMPSDDGCQAWAHAVTQVLGQRLTAIDLSRNSLTDDSMGSLASMFGVCTRTMLAQCVLSWEQTTSSIPACRPQVQSYMHAELRTLDLSYNTIGHKGVLLLCQHLSAATPLTSFSMAANRLPDGAGVPLAGLLLPCSACQLSSLDLSQNFSLGCIATRKLAQAMEYNTTLQHLHLSNCHLGESAVASMAKSLQCNASLSLLDISGCKLGYGGASRLSSMLAGNSAITHLSLAKNSLGDRGASAITTLLQSNHLINLDISYNQIRPSGAESLARVMHTCTALRHLDLSSNDLGDHGAISIMHQALNLVSIVLSQTGMTATGLIHIASWMSSNASRMQLQHLDLSKNNLGDKGIKSFCAAINSYTQLKTVNLSACQLGCSAGRAILSMLHMLSEAEAACNRHHSLQEISMTKNSRLDAVMVSNVQELLRHRQETSPSQQCDMTNGVRNLT